VKLPKRPHRRTEGASPVVAASEISSDELLELTTAFAAPQWLKNLGRASWLLVGVFALIAALVWFLGATYTIGGPVVAATIIATVAMPLVATLSRRMPRILAAALVLVGLVAIAVVILVLVIGGITSQHQSIAQHSSDGVTKAKGWLESVGVDKPGADGAAA
jgi:predicted PurR-regulated permease PerM